MPNATTFQARMPSATIWTRCRPGLLAGLLLASLWWPAASAQTGWTLRHSDDETGIRVWVQDPPGPYPRFRAQMALPNVRLAAVVAALRDTAAMPRWVYATLHAEPLPGQPVPSGAQGLSRVVSDLPWPLSDREALVRWLWTRNASDGSLVLSGRAATAADNGGALPETLPDTVRMPAHESSWTVRPLAPGAEAGVDIGFEGWADPGGQLSGPLLRGFVAAAVWQAPWQTLRGLRLVVVEPSFSHAALPDFLRSP